MLGLLPQSELAGAATASSQYVMMAILMRVRFNGETSLTGAEASEREERSQCMNPCMEQKGKAQKAQPTDTAGIEPARVSPYT